MRQYLVIATLLFGISVGALLPDIVQVLDKRSGKTVVFSDEFTEQDFECATNFLIDGHIREYHREEITIPGGVYKHINQERWNSYFQKYFVEKNPYQAHLIVARVDDQIVGMCAYYYVHILSQELAVPTYVPTLSVLGIFSECETYRPRTFMKGYRELALKKYPGARYWLGGARKNALLFHEAYRQAGFKETADHRLHLDERQCKKDQGFIRRIQKCAKAHAMDIQ
ncbi:hypothetical protein JST56_07695 [Candidatus Dependentiae bacterium]|nr:hypothetical protein [Candidatus Dependentiae bacterium]